MGITGSKENQLRRKIGKRSYAADIEDDGVKYVSTRTMAVTSKHPDTLVTQVDLEDELRALDIHESVTDIETTDHRKTWKITYESEEIMERNLHTLTSLVEENQTSLKPKPSRHFGNLIISGLFVDTQGDLAEVADYFKLYVKNPTAHIKGHGKIQISYDAIRRPINTNILHRQMPTPKVIKTVHQSKSIVDVISQLKTKCPDKFDIKKGLIAHKCKTENCQNSEW